MVPPGSHRVKLHTLKAKHTSTHSVQPSDVRSCVLPYMALSATQMMYVAEKISPHHHIPPISGILLPLVCCTSGEVVMSRRKVGLVKQAHGVVSQQRLHICNVTLICSPSLYSKMYRTALPAAGAQFRDRHRKLRSPSSC